jgi:hypothetical protein
MPYSLTLLSGGEEGFLEHPTIGRAKAKGRAAARGPPKHPRHCGQAQASTCSGHNAGRQEAGNHRYRKLTHEALHGFALQES